MTTKTQYAISGVLLVTTVFLLFRCVENDYRVSMAGSQAKTIWDLEQSALNETNAMAVVKTMDYIINLYPSGTAQKSNSSLDMMIEEIRSNSVRVIIGHLRTLPGHDYGDRPEAWIDGYNLPPRLKAR
jgi:hypothetical protein